MNKMITMDDIRRAAATSKKITDARTALAIRSDLTDSDFKRGATRYKIMGTCTEGENTPLWVCRPISAQDASQDLHLCRAEIEPFISSRMSQQHFSEDKVTGQVRIS